MDVTTMQSMPLLTQKLSSLYPAIHFTEGERFAWIPDSHEVTFTTDEPGAEALLLHELGHGLLAHTAYLRDVELIAMERAAWDKALEVATDLTTNGTPITIDDDFIEEHLDSYRDWLHARSTCPTCTATGYQTGASGYECPACHTAWRVNEARLCGLKRYKQ